jgi:transposase-like protein
MKVFAQEVPCPHLVRCPSKTSSNRAALTLRVIRAGLRLGRSPIYVRSTPDSDRKFKALLFVTGESVYALSKRHDISRQLIRVWVERYEAGALDEDAQAADLLQEYEAKIAALERMVGRQELEIEFLKGVLKNAPRPRSVNTSVVAGPAASPSQKDAG